MNKIPFKEKVISSYSGEFWLRKWSTSVRSSIIYPNNNSFPVHVSFKTFHHTHKTFQHFLLLAMAVVKELFVMWISFSLILFSLLGCKTMSYATIDMSCAFQAQKFNTSAIKLLMTSYCCTVSWSLPHLLEFLPEKLESMQK